MTMKEEIRCIKSRLDVFRNLYAQFSTSTAKPKIKFELNDFAGISYGLFKTRWPGLVIPETLVEKSKWVEGEFIKLRDAMFNVERERLLNFFKTCIEVEEKLIDALIRYSEKYK